MGERCDGGFWGVQGIGRRIAGGGIGIIDWTLEREGITYSPRSHMIPK